MFNKIVKYAEMKDGERKREREMMSEWDEKNQWLTAMRPYQLIEWIYEVRTETGF